MVKFLAITLASVVSAALANQDTAYYGGYTNPNLNDDMYYREAHNVLQDLSTGEFDSLYIRYHGCV